MRILRLWRDAPILNKLWIILGTLLGVMWIIVFFNVIQLRTLTTESGGIMREYGETTSFIDAVSTENRCLEAWMRPSRTAEDETAYLEAVRDTDARVVLLRPNLAADDHEEFMLKQAITNAMAHYREDLGELMACENRQESIQLYVRLQREAFYLNRYGVELLHCRMEAGEKSWEKVAETNHRNSRTILAFMIAATAITALGLMLLDRTMLKPLIRLGASADAISGGNYDSPPLPETSKDEIGRLAHSFNFMQVRVKDTILAIERKAEIEKENARMQEALQESRYAELQSQIDPHFLFNTLNAIAAMAAEEGAPITEDLIGRLAKIFRYSLESHEKRVTLGQELSYLGDYMELMDARFAGRISMHIEPFDPQLSTRTVPKFMLQTIAENSIIHGFQDIKEGGDINVQIREDSQGCLVIRMSDNGCGFDASALPEKREHHGVGLNNIQERLQYLNGRMEIDSRIGEGTRITIWISPEGDGNDQGIGG